MSGGNEDAYPDEAMPDWRDEEWDDDDIEDTDLNYVKDEEEIDREAAELIHEDDVTQP